MDSENRIVPLQQVSAETLTYSVPAGMHPVEVFDFNAFGIGLPVPFSVTDGKVRLNFTPFNPPVALCTAPANGC
ncbi:MAG: hypothetical protein HGA47_00110 [Zoogloea sp.]|nr:hypothetical protein [Zoogloea sp.]